MKHAGSDLLSPCTIGPAEVCTALADLVHGCDGGDSQDCMAVGQYLTSTPPYPMIATVFFLQACAIGDADGCERTYSKTLPAEEPCASDPFGCTVDATERQDLDRLDDACSLGVGDACSMLSWQYRDDPERSRAYLETACQLGLPMACEGLARSLSPDCQPGDLVDCYPPDELEASEARAISCRAGWRPADQCK